ncbi:MAG: SAM-dependent methyltransferase [Chitinophagaceae bacterium]|nr:MAG: SAM-dependent methyltransferase [Chitinophagaceae bacterium]
MKATVYLIPTYLSEDNLACLPANTIDYIKKCDSFFVENLRTARRYIKQLDKDFPIDEKLWFDMNKQEAHLIKDFQEQVKLNKTIGIISEAGCPGVADPGQILVAEAQSLNTTVVPLVGPSSILMALMASGMNGQQFSFLGYLPIDNAARIKSIKEIEALSRKNNATQIFIETPYRNNQLLETLVKTCQPQTLLCVAANITSLKEMIKTQSIQKWKNTSIDLHKQPVIYLLKG